MGSTIANEKSKTSKKDTKVVLKVKEPKKESKNGKKESKNEHKKTKKEIKELKPESKVKKGIEASLFGDVLAKTDNIDSSMSQLFGSGAANPISRPIKERTYLEPIAVDAPEEIQEDNDNDELEVPEPEKTVKKQKSKGDDDDELEAKYMNKLLDKEENDKEEEKDDDDNKKEKDESKVEQPQEAVEAKSVDIKEKELEKAERTVFIGNLTNEVLQNKKIEKQFKKKIEEIGKLESIRYRSIAFNEQIPKKVAFIQKKFHEFKDTINAYVVFQSKDSVPKCLKLNGEELLGHYLRVDSVAHPFKKDNSKTIFVGNLEFTEVDDTLWKFFGKIGSIEYVRIIRDPKTNLGKGFGYVQFKDETSVSKALLMNDKPLQTDQKKKARKVRVTRCKKSNSDKKLIRDSFDSKKVLNKNLNQGQKTKLGRAKNILGHKDREDAKKYLFEGTRASEGKGVSVKNGKIKKPRIKKPRHTERSKNFKKLKEGVEQGKIQVPN